jgi:hypothetical protein
LGEARVNFLFNRVATPLCISPVRVDAPHFVDLAQFSMRLGGFEMPSICLRRIDPKRLHPAFPRFEDDPSVLEARLQFHDLAVLVRG